MVKALLNFACKMFSGTAMANIGEAEPIRKLLSFGVFEIFAEMHWRREIIQFFARSSALIGRIGNPSSGFSCSRLCASDDTPTRWHSINRLESAMERILLLCDWTTLLGCLLFDVAKKDQRRNGLIFFVDSSRSDCCCMGFGPDICQMPMV